MQNNFLTISVVINCFLSIVAGVLFGTDRTRRVNVIPAALILALSTEFYCLYLGLLDAFWLIVLNVLQASASISTIVLVEHQREMFNKEDMKR